MGYELFFFVVIIALRSIFRSYIASLLIELNSSGDK